MQQNALPPSVAFAKGAISPTILGGPALPLAAEPPLLHVVAGLAVSAFAKQLFHLPRIKLLHKFQINLGRLVTTQQVDH